MQRTNKNSTARHQKSTNWMRCIVFAPFRTRIWPAKSFLCRASSPFVLFINPFYVFALQSVCVCACVHRAGMQCSDVMSNALASLNVLCRLTADVCA